MKNTSSSLLAEILRSPVPPLSMQVSGYKIHSNQVLPGELFFALKGEKSDGHDFLGEVKQRGGVGAVVSKKYGGPDYGLALFRVDDVSLSLQGLARDFLRISPVQIVGVTGSVGKTTTKDFIATILEGKYRVGKTQESQNSQLTLPLSALNRTGNEEVLVLEMGMSEPGEIARLVGIAPPDIAVLTKVALAHAAYFPGGLPEIARAKGEIFSHPKTKFAVFDHDYFAYPESSSKIFAEKCSFSLCHKEADYFLSSEQQGCLICEKGVLSPVLKVPFPQTHILHDFLAAVCVARRMGLQWNEIEAQLPKLQLPKMRFERWEKGGVLFINDAYNANPESMKAALRNLPTPRSGGKRIAVLGTMKELGSLSKDLHREIGHFAKPFVDHLLALGEEAASVTQAFSGPSEWFGDHQSLALRLKEIMKEGDVVLIKGSRSMSMEKILELL